YVNTDVRGVINVTNGHVLSYQFGSQFSVLYGEDSQFGLELTPAFSAMIPGQGQVSLSLSVSRTMENVHSPGGSSPLPSGLVARRCVPNPFSVTTSAVFTVGAPERPVRVSVRVFDVTSRLVKTLFRGELPSGHYSVEWDGRNEKGRRVPSGVYFVRLEAEGTLRTVKVVKLE
ncbi:MAG: FlgD immunoglobulin-like domain containing protein, partial [Candidatus Eisenbacteria bacterium]